MKAAIYCRVSTENQEREGTSLASQKEACLAKAQELGYGVSEEHIILEAFSGLTLDRPELTKLRDKASNNEIDAVVIHSPDRLSRVGEDILSLAKEFKLKGIKLIFVKDQWDDTLNGKLIAFMLGWFAEFEVTQIKERSMRGIRERVKGGRLAGGGRARLFGYTYIPGKGIGEGIRVINEDEASWVGRIYHWFVNDRLALNEIVYRLRALGVNSPSGNSYWVKSSVHKILSRIAYTGKTFAFTQKRVKAEIHKKTSTKVIQRPREEWVEIPNATPPIISEELFSQAQARLQRNKELASRNTKTPYLLSGYVFCRQCGRRYYGGGITRKQSEAQYRYYRCPRNSRIISPQTCANQGVEANYFERLVWDKIKELLCNPDFVLAGLEIRQNEAQMISSHQAEMEMLETQQRKAEREKNRVWRAFELTGDELKFIGEIKVIMERIEALEKQKAELGKRVELSQQAEADIDSIREFCELARSNISDFTFEDKRLALEALAIKVWVDNGNITIEGAIPMVGSKIASNTLW